MSYGLRGIRPIRFEIRFDRKKTIRRSLKIILVTYGDWRPSEHDLMTGSGDGVHSGSQGWSPGGGRAIQCPPEGRGRPTRGSGKAQVVVSSSVVIVFARWQTCSAESSLSKVASLLATLSTRNETGVLASMMCWSLTL